MKKTQSRQIVTLIIVSSLVLVVAMKAKNSGLCGTNIKVLI